MRKITDKLEYLKGFGYSTFFAGLKKVSGLVGITVLSRHLSPSDFGIYAVAFFLIEFVKIIGDSGIIVSAIQTQEDPTENELSSVFFFQEVIILFLLLILFIVGPIIPKFYAEFKIEYLYILYALGVEFLLSSLKAVPKILLTRDEKFKFISNIDYIENLIYWSVAITLAVNDYGVWSLVCAVVSRSTIGSILFFRKVKWLPKWHYNFQEVKKYLRFGIEFQLARIIEYASGSVATVFISTMFGVKILGFISWGQHISKTPRFLLTALDSVSLPFFSRLQDNLDEVEKYLLKSIDYIVFLIYPALAILNVFADGFITHVFSKQWLEAKEVLLLCSINFGITVLCYPFYTSLCGLGRAGLFIKVNLAKIIMEVAIIYMTKDILGYKSILYAIIVTELMIMFVYIGYYKVQFNRFINVFNILFKNLFILTLTIYSNSFFKAMIPDTFLGLILGIIVFGILYLIFSLIFNYKLFKEAKNILMDYVGKKVKK